MIRIIVRPSGAIGDSGREAEKFPKDAARVVVLGSESGRKQS
jgi:hypothetical protein